MATAVVAGAWTLLALVLFAEAFWRLRRRGRADHAGWDRALLFLMGLALVVGALVPPLEEAAEERLAAHMLQHVLIADAGPALILVALRGPLVFFLIPGAVLAPLARLAGLRAFLRFLLRPRVSFAFWAVALGVWHYPPAYEYALQYEAVHVLEHATFVIAGLLVWTQLVDPGRRGELRIAGRIALAAALFAAGQILADVLIFSFEPLYGVYGDEGDQQLAGLVMMLEQALTLGTCAALLVWAQHQEVVRREGAAIRPLGAREP
jgi:cytochrome c oxidase assembly factor CtaG